MSENENYTDRLAAWEKGRFAPQQEPELHPFNPTFSENVSMRDGVGPYTEVFCQRDTGKTTQLVAVSYADKK